MSDKSVLAKFNAEMFGKASYFCSRDGWRRNLHGVYIFRSDFGGVHLVATNAYHVVFFYDEDGYSSLDELYIPRRPSSVSIVGEVLNSASVGFNPKFSTEDYIALAGGLKDSADPSKIFVILPDGKSQLIKRSLFSSNKDILPGSTIVVSRDSRPFDAISLTQIITPILADLATSAAAIAAISD